MGKRKAAHELLAEHKLRVQVAELKSERKALLQALKSKEEALGVAEAMRAAKRPPKAIRKRATAIHAKRQATAVLCCSDWHVGERVRPGQVNGLNSYDPAEAERRIRNLSEGVCWLIEHHRKGWEIREVVVWFGGDLITGYLHPDQQESNTMSPNSEVCFVQEHAGNLLADIGSMTGIERVIVPTSRGNHGRTTHKPRVATSAENSYEWLLYQQMRREFARDSRFDFHVDDGELSYLDIYGYQCRFTHGDAIRFGGGVGGITIPINKAVAKWDTYRRADITFMGHWHEYMDLPHLVVNGSLIGQSAYGMRVASNQDPRQAFCLIDQSRGKCQSTPIWVTTSKRRAA